MKVREGDLIVFVFKILVKLGVKIVTLILMKSEADMCHLLSAV